MTEAAQICPLQRALPTPARLVLLLRLWLCLLLLLAGTAAWAATAKPRPATPVPALPMRLGPDVVPQAYALALKLDPSQPGHSGQIEIDLKLRQPMRSIRLHAKDLVVPQAWPRKANQSAAR